MKSSRRWELSILPHFRTRSDTIEWSGVEWSETFSDQNQTPFILPGSARLLYLIFWSLSFSFVWQGKPKIGSFVNWPAYWKLGAAIVHLTALPIQNGKLFSILFYLLPRIESTFHWVSNANSWKPTMIYIQYPEGITYLNSIELQHTLSMFVFNVLAQLHYWKLKQWSCRSF